MNPLQSKNGQNQIHVLQIVGEPVGGIRKHVHSLIYGLDDTKFVQSYAYSNTITDTRFKQEIESFRTRLHGEIPLHIRKRPHLTDLTNLWKLLLYVKNQKVDVLHGHGAKGGLYARLVGVACGIPAIYTPHGGVVHRMFNPLEDRLYTFVEKCLIGLTYCYVFESHYSAEGFFSKVGRIKRLWLVNYNGIEAIKDDQQNLALDSLPKDKTHIGVLGILRPEKGQIHLVNAVISIARSGLHNIHLHIFGDGPDREKLENLILDSKMTDISTFYGDVSNPDEWMAKMDIIVIPSLFESFGYVGVEAMALSKPVIASSVGGLREVFDNQTALLIPPADDEALQDAIVQCIKNPEATSAMAKRGRLRCADKFSLDKMIEVISKYYTDAVFS